MSINLQPLIAEGFVIFWHAIFAMTALVLALWQLWATKGTKPHRILGGIWMGLMATVALSSFWIHSIGWIGPFSPIHVLSVITLINLPLGWLTARRGNIARHRTIMLSLVFTGLVLPGAFTLIPGRAMHAVFFGG